MLETVQRFFDAMTNRDAEAALEVMIPEGRFFSLREENGETAVRTFTNQEFGQGLETQEQDLLERFWADGEPPPPQSFTTVAPYPPTSIGAASG